MDLFSCIALIVFSLIILIGRFIFVKKDMMSPLDLKKPFRYGYTAFALNLFLILMGLGTGTAGVVCLLKLLL